LQKKQTLQWKVDSYNTTNLKISALRESVSSARFASSWSKIDANGNSVRLSEDEIVAKVKDIVSKYNDTVSTLNTDITETVNRGYSPLTSDEKSAMSETDVKNWETKAKAGLLHNDDILKQTLSSMRSVASTKVGGVSDADYDTLSEIGISTPKFLKGSADNGKLVIDETKLRSAIRENPDAVIQTFTNQSSTSGEKGIFQRIYEYADNAVLNISRKVNGGYKTAESITQQMTKLDKKVEDMNEKLNKKEDRYYAMFANMEKALQNGNAQMSWLAAQFG